MESVRTGEKRWYIRDLGGLTVSGLPRVKSVVLQRIRAAREKRCAARDLQEIEGS